MEINKLQLFFLEYDGYDDVYGHSVDDSECISPTDANQWIYDRTRGRQSMSEFLANNDDIEEEDEQEQAKERHDSEVRRNQLVFFLNICYNICSIIDLRTT